MVRGILLAVLATMAKQEASGFPTVPTPTVAAVVLMPVPARRRRGLFSLGIDP